MMDPEFADRHLPDLSLGKAALAGAALFAALCLLFWATATAQTLSPTTPDWVRGFTPAAGIARLIEGMLWSAVFGAALFILLAGARNLVRKGLRSSIR